MSGGVVEDSRPVVDNLSTAAKRDGELTSPLRFFRRFCRSASHHAGCFAGALAVFVLMLTAVLHAFTSLVRFAGLGFRHSLHLPLLGKYRGRLGVGKPVPAFAAPGAVFGLPAVPAAAVGSRDFHHQKNLLSGQCSVDVINVGIDLGSGIEAFGVGIFGALLLFIVGWLFRLDHGSTSCWFDY
jgi:hypothetical protein